MKKGDYINIIEEKKKKVGPVLKTVVTFGLAAVLSFAVFGLVGCGKDNSQTNEVPTPVEDTTEPTLPAEKPTENASEKGNTTEKGNAAENAAENTAGNSNSNSTEVAKVPVEKIAKFVESVDNNFTYEKNYGNEKLLYKLADENLYYKNTETGEDYYVIEENDNVFQYELNEQDGKYHKTLSTSTFSFSNVVYEDLSTAEWTAYDASTQIFSGTLDGESVSLKIEDGQAYLSGSDWTSKIYDVDATNVNVPSAELVVDETVENQNIYEIVDGEYVFNIPLIYEVLSDFMVGTDVYNAIVGNSTDRGITKIVYVNPTATELKFAGFGYRGNSFVYQTFRDRTDYNGYAWEKNLSKIQTKDDFKNYLYNNKRYPLKVAEVSVEVEYSTIEGSGKGTAEQLEEFETLTTNVLNKLATTGYQGSSIKNEGTPVKDIDKANILWGFKTKAGGENAGADIGFKREWGQYYLIEQNGEMKFIKVLVDSSTDLVKDEKQHVLNNDSKGWFVTGYYETEINNENLQFYDESAKTQSVATTSKIDLYFEEQKTKEL